MPQPTIAVIGLGYVGLPLAVTFGRKFPTIGFDIKQQAIESYKRCHDPNCEVTEEGFKAAQNIIFTSDPADIGKADYCIVAVPTPIDSARQPDLSPLKGASTLVGKNMKQGAVVIFESTVYPGTTEEVCVPILEKESGMKWKKDFFVGYSPERINPGDKEHTLTKIVKVVSGDTEETLDKVASLYGAIIDAGVYRAASVKEAEAAKVIENTQRDLNIALMNELAVIFDKLDIDTLNVLEAAGTKWNFLPFRPGLVGGHCIGVDPYYLTYKAETMGYHPEVILAGRRINDGMGKFVADKTIKLMLQGKVNLGATKVGILGLTFKENCPDLRNSRVVDIIDELKTFGIEILVHDPRAESAEAEKFFGISLCRWEDLKDLGALILAVPHREYLEKSIEDFTGTLSSNGCLVDVKSVLDVKEIQEKGVRFWRL
ncbi:MAG: nucleotide sugar dehydrogenase [Desulfobulbaceae bacterium]|uniref:Nucleotide sugar dehydrogenase n=1 Tax=Candidatus Desulfobia pelagia TaxID=2841692 RepID=A0A8J6NAX4_9BACT|nr:nucleotide sugar dehydrogenase [Candidatus Desulfobia pelagia]